MYAEDSDIPRWSNQFPASVFFGYKSCRTGFKYFSVSHVAKGSVNYTFMHPQNRKSRGVKSGDSGGWRLETFWKLFF